MCVLHVGMCTRKMESAMRIEDGRHVKHDGKGVTILAPTTGNMRSYHTSGKSPKEEYLEAKRRAKDHIECVKREFRL